MQSHAVHEFVHDEGSTRHVARILKQGNKEIKNEDVGQENDDTAHTTDDAVAYQALQGSFRHIGSREFTDLPHQPVDGLHGIFAQHKRGLEDEEEHKEKQGKTQITVGYDTINA